MERETNHRANACFRCWRLTQRTGFIMNPSYRRLRFRCACLLIAGLTLVLSQGCDEVMERRAMPAPLRDSVETTFSGKVARIWSGDNFEFISGKETHYLMLRGVDAPGPGEPFFHHSRDEIRRLTKSQEVSVVVFERDELMREVAEVTVPVSNQKGDFDSDEFDLGVELIKRGWARHNGVSFDGVERLIEAEASAKKRKVGIWAEPTNTSKKKSNDKK